MPVFIENPKDQKNLKEKDCKFEAIIKSISSLKVEWIVNNKELINSNKDGIKIEKDLNKNKYSLILTKLNMSIDEIICRASNENGIVERKVKAELLGNTLFIKKIIILRKTHIIGK